MRHLISFTLLFVASYTCAQVKFEGVVRDTLNEPLYLANVIAINQATTDLESYAITNEEGKFKLELGENGTFELQISYVGMKTYKEVITTSSTN
ncbi:MAG: carboxypeptidase-like regulatory domain-containing protein, partial [Bacteroidia bacterium]|nr:carboxypeptidase-like regulatory domain-containing protein [Bacteroidia bacterium]